MKTIKEILIFIRDEPGFLEEYKFLCNCAVMVRRKGFISERLLFEFEDYLHKHKPVDNTLTKSHSWIGWDKVWWDIREPYVFVEKRRFLTYLIDNYEN